MKFKPWRIRVIAGERSGETQQQRARVQLDIHHLPSSSKKKRHLSWIASVESLSTDCSHRKYQKVVIKQNLARHMGNIYMWNTISSSQLSGFVSRQLLICFSNQMRNSIHPSIHKYIYNINPY